ncbi:MAG: lysophospholipase [Anaerolineae bacterium]|nr:lysophospholipase [Anaerolineae bacterium]
MKTFEWEWTSFDGLKMYSKGWSPEKDPKAVVYLVHGLGEHIGRYEHVGAAFAEAGYAMLGFDLRGHGKSGGPRGHTPSAEAYYKDIDSFLAEAAKRYPSAPRFIYGHSLGGFLSLAYSLSRKPDLRGMIVSSPGLRTALHEQKVKVTLAKVLGAIAPTITLPSGLNAEHISRDPQVVKAYVNDPLVHDKTSTGFGRAALQAGEFVFAHAAELSTPILLAYCSEDKLAFPRGSEEFASLAPKGLVTVKRFDGLYHEPHNEPEKAEVLKTYVQWLDGRMNS